jgi:hypothetical protein
MTDRRRLLGLLLVVATVAALAAGSPSPADARAAKCAEGTKMLAGRYVRVFCGPARASLVVAGRTFSFRPGECFRSKDFTNVNVGTFTVGTSPVARYLRVVGPSRDGAALRGTVSWQLPGLVDGIRGARLTLAAKGTRGTFSGRTYSGRPAKGSFTCS